MDFSFNEILLQRGVIQKLNCYLMFSQAVVATESWN